LMFHLNPQFFTGREDMIFELNVDIVMNNDCKLDNKDLVKEHILGTVLKEIQNHFDVYYSVIKNMSYIVSIFFKQLMQI
jgi:hypothetical protein